jgi:pimeloyl-ACP methyl ester carboxylesterase
MALTNNEKMYITEKYLKWTHGNIRFWESLPYVNPDEPGSSTWVEESKNKPCILMIHGYGAMLEHYRRTFAGLKNRYRLYAIDLLGFGGSAKPSGSEVQYSAKLWAQQVYDFLRTKKEEKVILVGHSMGGMVSMQFKLLHPEMVAGLVLIDTAGLPDQGRAEQENYHRNVRINWGDITFNAIKTPGVGEAMAALLTIPNGWATRRFLEGAYYNKAKITPQLIEQFTAPLRQPGASASYLAVTRSFADFQLPIKPGDIEGPVLIIWGEHDRMMPPDRFIPRWTNLIPQAETYRVSEAAHCPQDERPDLVNPVIMRFVEKVAGNLPTTGRVA